MANLIKPGDVKIITKNNEVFVNISLELNIKLDGNVTNLISESKGSSFIEQKKQEEEKVHWEIPDFSMNAGKLNFGKES
jgi:hypothetical protein